MCWPIAQWAAFAAVDEPAACLGIPEATVRTRYFRAKGQLREALARESTSA